MRVWYDFPSTDPEGTVNIGETPFMETTPTIEPDGREVLTVRIIQTEDTLTTNVPNPKSGVVVSSPLHSLSSGYSSAAPSMSTQSRSPTRVAASRWAKPQMTRFNPLIHSV